MKISWMGHSCFLLETAQATKIITDPYEHGSYSGSIRYEPINIEPDIITVSHQHFDHNYTKDMPHARVIDREGSYKIADVQIEGISSYHDHTQGSERGTNLIFIINSESLRIVHFGDIGTQDLDYRNISNIDIAFIPVGGTFTVDTWGATQILEHINPKITIPMHFKTPKVDFEIAPVDIFLRGKPSVENRKNIEVTPLNIHTFKKIVVLDYLR